jgi:ubiquinone/menaquinone biosynthesis C-methylase UbiE
MGMSSDGGASARATYDTLAPVYDRFSADFDHETWVARLLAVAEEAGATGRRVLDVACGTGKSFEPFLRRGYDVSACDISPEMVELARERAGGRAAHVFVADMRDLPPSDRPFDLITCLDDAVNYLLTSDDLARAFGSAARLLRPGGFYIFDTNTLQTYRTAFAQDTRFDRSGWHFLWHGEGRADAAPGARATATVLAESPAQTLVARHVQRHHPAQTIRAELAAAGFEPVAELGQTTGGVLHREPCEANHNKLVFIARRSSTIHAGLQAEEMTIIP